MEILGLKSMINYRNEKFLDGPISRFELAEERISKLKDRLIEIMQPK